MLSLLTRAKYRVMSATYFTFRLADNVVLIAILYYWLIGETPSFHDVHAQEVVVVLTAELMYDIFEFFVNFWMLNRAMPWLGMMLYGAYLGIFLTLKQHHLQNQLLPALMP